MSKIRVASNSSYLPGTIGEKYAKGTEELRGLMRPLFKKRTVSTWLHITCDLLTEETVGMKAGKRKKEALLEIAALRKLAYETRYTRI